MKKSLLLVSMFSASLTSTAFAANNALSEQALSTIKQLAAKPKLVQAVTKINTQRQADGRKVLSANKKQWKQEYVQKQGKLITAMTKSPLAKWLNTQVKQK